MKRVKAPSNNDKQAVSDDLKKRRESSFEDEIRQTNLPVCLIESTGSKKLSVADQFANTPPSTPPRKQRKRASISPSVHQITNEIKMKDDKELPVEHNCMYISIVFS